MKPKLWDGPNAVGEARMRALEQVATPYISASGPGFTASKKGQFSEVTGSTTAPEEVVEANWWSTSNNADEVVVITGGKDYRSLFQPRGHISNAAAGRTGSGTILSSDGRGTGFLSTYDGMSDEGRISTYTTHRAFSGGRRLSAMFSYLVYNRPTQYGPFGYFAIGTGASMFRDEQGSYAVQAFTARYEADGWERAKPVIQISAGTPGGGWGTAVVTLPMDTTDGSVDASVPAIAALGLTSLVAAYAATPLSPPKLYASTDLGQSWSSGVDISPLWGGVDPWLDATGIDRHPVYNSSGYPHTEEFWMSADGGFAQYPLIQRSRYLSDLPTEVAKRWGGFGIHIEPASANKVVIITGYRYFPGVYEYTGGKIAVGVFNTSGSMIRRVEWDADAAGYLLMLGRGTWVVLVSNSGWSEWRLTKDYGATYTPTFFIPGTKTFFPITPYVDEDTPFLIGLVVEEGDEVRVYTTDNFTSFHRAGRIGSGGVLGRPLSGADFSKAVNIGTRGRPGPIDPCYPWTRDYRYDVPAWWNE